MLLGPITPHERDTLVYALLTQRNRLNDDLEEGRRSADDVEPIIVTCNVILRKIATKKQLREDCNMER